MGPSTQAVLEGHPLSLLCATNVLSNPQPTITWTDPSGMEIASNSRIATVTDSTGVRLTFADVTMADNGTWTCNIRVESFNVRGPGGITYQHILIGEELIPVDLLVIGKLLWEINVKVLIL